MQSIERSASADFAPLISAGQPGPIFRIRHLAGRFRYERDRRGAAAQRDVSPCVDRHYRTLAADGVANDQYLDNVDQWYLYKTNVDRGSMVALARIAGRLDRRH